MKIKNAEFSSGISAGLPICLGYISVAFVFGIYAVEAGLTPVESLLVSMFNLTSAGQFAAVSSQVSAHFRNLLFHRR